MTNKNKKMLDGDAMANLLLTDPTKTNLKGGKGAKDKASGQTDTCGCAIF